MSYTNNYTATAEPTVPKSDLYGPEPYDINYAFPLPSETLDAPRVKLVPFVPRVHAETYWENVKDHRDTLYRYYSRFWHNLDEWLEWHELAFRRNPYEILLAVIDKTRPDPAHADWGGSFAGLVGLIDVSVRNLQMEPGYIMVFPAFQHTHVAKDMIGVSLNYILQLPSESPPGLGFRRAQWVANSLNVPSIKLAERMGFKREGTLRHVAVIPKENVEYGRKGRSGDPYPELASRDSAFLSLCWDEWVTGEREKVQAILA
ncbi:acyl-CoA N-acyltransferase [Lenzites betulinus]|nr:acyl-CoA N-acyltransferase [Lenzites betulinus]